MDTPGTAALRGQNFSKRASKGRGRVQEKPARLGRTPRAAGPERLRRACSRLRSASLYQGPGRGAQRLSPAEEAGGGGAPRSSRGRWRWPRGGARGGPTYGRPQRGRGAALATGPLGGGWPLPRGRRLAAWNAPSEPRGC